MRGRTLAILQTRNLAAAGDWSKKPKILSAGLGFEGIAGAEFGEGNKGNALAAGASWRYNASCDAEKVGTYIQLRL